MSILARSHLLALIAIPLCLALPARADLDPVIQAIDAFALEQDIDDTNPLWRVKLARPPQLEFDADKTYYWTLETDVGDMKFELFPDIAPMHVSNLIYLTRLGFYDGLFFHRIVRGFVAQSGDPLGNGKGGPGYLLDGEFTKEGKGRHRKPGVLSAANAGPGTDGSQFFITFKTVKQLDGKNTVYGRLVEGKDTLRALDKAGSSKGTPKKRIEIIEASVSVE